MNTFDEIISAHKGRFGSLPIHFEGNSRILKQTDIPGMLLSKLKPTVFSIEANGPVPAPGIDIPRTGINAILCRHLHEQGIMTSTLHTVEDLILVRKEQVPPIEVVVKGALIGSPKHIYKGLDTISTRFGKTLAHGGTHTPYVRFDWRNPLPHADLCMPEGLADYFIDRVEAQRSAFKAFEALKGILNKAQMDLLDICFFMNVAGTVICAEISTDNTTIVYTGPDRALKQAIASKDKSLAVKKAEAVLSLLKQAKLG